MTAQFAAEATLRRVHAAQKDDDMPPIETILAPLEAELELARQEDLPEGSWYCSNCICQICKDVVNRKEALSTLAMLECSQCEHKYHDTCIMEKATCNVDTWFCGERCWEDRDKGIGHYIPKVKSAIESILRSCHRMYSLALLTSSKTIIGWRVRQVLAGQPVRRCIQKRTDRSRQSVQQQGSVCHVQQHCSSTQRLDGLNSSAAAVAAL